MRNKFLSINEKMILLKDVKSDSTELREEAVSYLFQEIDRLESIIKNTENALDAVAKIRETNEANRPHPYNFQA